MFFSTKFSFKRSIFTAIFVSLIIVITLIVLTYALQQKTDSGVSNASTDTDDLIYNQLKNVQWDAKLLISKGDIPLPESMKNAPGAKIKSLYSPSVIKKSDGYYMTFGVSLYCTPKGEDLIARDSIALAWSPDSDQWVFLRYLIEPDAASCFKKTSEFSEGMIFQVNDPYMFTDNSKYIRVLYTATVWKPSKNQYGCGNIGIAAFDTNFNLIFRNDSFLVDESSCTAATGISRPSLRKLSHLTHELWFDSSYQVKAIPLTAVDSMGSISNIPSQTIVAGDVDTPNLDFSLPLLLYNGGNHNIYGITAQTKKGNVWTKPWEVTKLTGAQWDNWFHGSPALFLEPPCTPVIYFAGFTRATDESGSVYPSGSIAKVIPKPGQNFIFQQCR